MLQLDFNPFPLLTTARLTLRAVRAADLEEVYFLRSDPRVMQYLDRPVAADRAEAKEYLTKAVNQIAENQGITWAITEKGKDKMIGYIGYWRIDFANYRAEVGYALHPDFWRKGLITEALTAALDYAFEQTDIHSVLANVNPVHVGSIAVLKKQGFRQEAHFREDYYFNGKFIDSAIFCLLKTDRRLGAG